MSDKLQQRLLAEMKSKTAFNLAQKYAYQYADAAPTRNVYPTDDALNRLINFDQCLPEESTRAEQIVEMLHRFGSPSTVCQIAGRYFGFVNGGVLPATLAVRWLADFWDQNAALFVTSPLVAKLEEVCERWLKSLLALPCETVAGFVSGSSTALLCGLAATRFQIFHQLGWDVNKRGLRGCPEINIVVGEAAHATVIKAIALLGFGTDHIRWVECDAEGRMRAECIPPLSQNTIVVAQAGEVHTGAFDPLKQICDKVNAADGWTHIDGAFGLWAAASPRLSHLVQGMERANSWSVDGHKTLNTPYDSGIVLCRNPQALKNSMHACGSYINYSGEYRDGMVYTTEMSRRARSVELWAAIKSLGRLGVGELVLGLHEKAELFATQLRGRGFRILNEVVFNQVLVACDDDQQTQQTLYQIQRSSICWVGGAQWQGKSVIRVSISAWATTETDIHHTVDAFCAARLRAGD